jgi:ribosome biogenesis protein NSA1
MEHSLRLLATDELGIVRVATAASKETLEDSLTMVTRWGDASRARRIVRCSTGQSGDGGNDEVGGSTPGSGSKTCAANGWLAVARFDHTVEVMECASGASMGGGGIDVEGLPVSVGLYGPGAGRSGARLITVTEEGDAIVHAAPCGIADDDAAAASFASFGSDDRIVEEWSESVRWKAIGHAACARAGAGGSVLALGGKGQGNDLKLYDVETQKLSFKVGGAYRLNPIQLTPVAWKRLVTQPFWETIK